MDRHHHEQPNYGTDPNTTFVEADPSNFRTIVQKLTGNNKLPLTANKPAFKLHERRRTAGKLELKLNNNGGSGGSGGSAFASSDSESCLRQQRGFLVSPVSQLDHHYWRRISPGSAREEETHAHEEEEEEEEEEERRAMAEKGFYLHRSTPRETHPELLPLFPLHSPRQN